MQERNYDIVEKALNCPVTRRQVLKSLVAAGVLVAVPGGFMRAATSTDKINYDEIFYEGPYETFRNACPRNCYDTCSILTYVKDGAVQFFGLLQPGGNCDPTYCACFLVVFPSGSCQESSCYTLYGIGFCFSDQHAPAFEYIRMFSQYGGIVLHGG